MRFAAAAAIFSVCVIHTAMAAPLPSAVEAMIRASAGEDGLDAVVKAAKATNPASIAEIDALVNSLKSQAAAAHQERLMSAGIWDNWSGAGALGFSRTTGNSEDMTLSGTADLTKDGLYFRHKFHGAVERQTSGGVLNHDRYLAGYELDYKFSSSIYAYGSVAWEKDNFAGIRRRLSESGGVGYIVLDTDAVKLDVSAGPAFQQSRYVTSLAENSTTLRAGVDFSWKVFEHLTLSERAEMFVNSEIKSTTALTIPIQDKLSAQLAFDFIHQEHVPLGRVATDTATHAALVYSF